MDLAQKGEVPNAYVALLGLKPRTTKQLLGALRKGLDFSAYQRLQASIEIPAHELAEVLQIPQRTLVRRRGQGRLAPTESDRVLRVSRLFALALQLFEGEEAAARAWLLSSQHALGDQRPIDLMRTEIGAREVETLIGRLENGVFS